MSLDEFFELDIYTSIAMQKIYFEKHKDLAKILEISANMIAGSGMNPPKEYQFFYKETDKKQVFVDKKELEIYKNGLDIISRYYS